MAKKYNRVHIEKNTVQETLIIPLYSRKLCTELYPNLYQDKSAVELLSRLDYDFSEMEKKSMSSIQRFGSLEVAMRQTNLAIEVREYLEKHPNAAVVNLGCGLDQTGENCDNGSCKIYNLDFPDVIGVRNELIPASDRVTNISVNLNDTTWFEQIDGSEGAVFFASGVFYYFKQEEIRTLVNAMAEHFRGGKLVFDAAGKFSVRLMIKSFVKKSGINNVDAMFYIDDMDKDIRSWLKNATASCKGYMLGYNNFTDPSISRFFRFLAKRCDGMMKMKIVRIDFGE